MPRIRARRTADPDIDAEIIRLRVAGETLVAIQRRTGAGPERVRRVLTDWAAATIDPGLRREVFTATIHQLEELIRGLWPKALAGHVPSALAINRLMGRRNGMLGLRAPVESVVTIVDDRPPQRAPTSFDRLEAAVNRMVDEHRREDARHPGRKVERLRQELAEAEAELAAPPLRLVDGTDDGEDDATTTH